MGKLLIIISTIAFLLTGCSEDTKPEEQNVVKEPSFGSKAEVTEGDFIYRLVSEKSVYVEGEKVEVFAELEYVGDEPEIEIAHAASPFYFPMKEKTRNFEIGYMMNEPLIVTALKKGVPLREQYIGGGGYGSQDPKEYVDFIKEVMAGSQKGTLPWGDYRMSGLASFKPNYDSEETKEIRLKAEIEFIVEKSKNESEYDVSHLELTLPDGWSLNIDRFGASFADENGINMGGIVTYPFAKDFNFEMYKPNHSEITNEEAIDTPIGSGKLYTLDADNGTAASGITGTHDVYFAVVPFQDKIIYVLEFTMHDKEAASKEQFVRLLNGLQIISK